MDLFAEYSLMTFVRAENKKLQMQAYKTNIKNKN